MLRINFHNKMLVVVIIQLVILLKATHVISDTNKACYEINSECLFYT